jgi:hypothetical protein
MFADALAELIKRFLEEGTAAYEIQQALEDAADLMEEGEDPEAA